MFLHLLLFHFATLSLAHYEEISNEFLVRVNSCSGSLISDHWVLTAAHCMRDFKTFGSVDPEDADIKLGKEVILVKKNLRGSKFKKQTRSAARVIIHKGFLGEALSWKGFDLALIKLSKPFDKSDNSTNPICLPSTDFREHSENLYIAGFGRRQTPYCVTDTFGPEKLALCGRPKDCKDRAKKCGLEFVYRNKTYKECIRDQLTPSANDPICTQLSKKLYFSNKKRIRAHILIESIVGLVHKTTCYLPLKPFGNGWCTVRDSKNAFDIEPKSNEGWGYCSDDEKYCNGEIRDFKRTFKAQKVHLLSQKHCLDKLGANLAVEQPEVRPEQYRHHLFNTFKVFCAGKKQAINHQNDHYFILDEKNKTFLRLTPHKARHHVNLSQTVVENNSCFGDSGGALFHIANVNSNKAVPVLMGVFSFMLWGTCRGRDEMSYFVRVRELTQWIFKYVDEKQVCVVNRQGVLRNSFGHI